MYVLGTEHMSSERTVSAFNYGAISPVPMSGIYMWVLGFKLRSSHRKISILPTERDIFLAPGAGNSEQRQVNRLGTWQKTRWQFQFWEEEEVRRPGWGWRQ